jgi:hypothetical protein
MNAADEAFFHVVADYATDAGWVAHLLMCSLVDLPAYIEARRLSAANASERVVRLQLDKAMVQAGLAPQAVD